MAYANGLFPTSATTALATAPGQRLEATAARQWDALARSVQNAYGWLPVLTDSYRPYSVQERIFRDRYRAGAFSPYGDYRTWLGQRWGRRAGTAAAAVPGTSNHGWAKAVDVSGLGGFGGAKYRQLASLAPQFGFTNTEGRSVNEAWHWVFTGAYQVSNPIGGNGSAVSPDFPDAPAPIDPIEEDDMLVIARTANDPTVWIGDGVTRRRIATLDTLKTTQWLIDQGILRAKTSAVQTIEDLWSLGYPVDVVDEQTVDSVNAIPGKVWSTTVNRGGTRISALQELADAKTIAASVQGENAGLRAAVDALATGKALTADQISEAARKGAEAALKGGVKVTIDIPKEG